MKVLLGTTNPSKVKRFSELLANCNIEFITLKELEISQEPEEVGKHLRKMPYVKQNFTDSILMLLFVMTQVYILRNLI